MSTPQFVFVSNNVKSEVPIVGAGGVLTSYSASAKELTISVSPAAQPGQLANVTYVALASDYVPTNGVPITGSVSNYSYNANALFWTIPYTPKSSSATLYMIPTFQCSAQSSSAASGGIWFAFYAANTPGTAPITGLNPPWMPCSLANSSPVAIQGMCSGLLQYTVTSNASINFYVCAYTIGTVASPVVLSSASTITAFGGACASTLMILEVAN